MLGWPRAAGVLGLVAIAALLVGGCGSGAEASAGQDWRVAAGQYVDKSGPLAAPKTLPKGLDNAQGVTLEGQPGLTFYSPGEPLVTVCSGDVKICRTVLGTGVEIRSGVIAGRRFVIALGRSEDPKADPALSPAAAKYWRDVRLTASRPQWLSSSS